METSLPFGSPKDQLAITLTFLCYLAGALVGLVRGVTEVSADLFRALAQLLASTRTCGEPCVKGHAGSGVPRSGGPHLPSPTVPGSAKEQAEPCRPGHHENCDGDANMQQPAPIGVPSSVTVAAAMAAAAAAPVATNARGPTAGITAGAPTLASGLSPTLDGVADAEVQPSAAVVGADHNAPTAIPPATATGVADSDEHRQATDSLTGASSADVAWVIAFRSDEGSHAETQPGSAEPGPEVAIADGDVPDTVLPPQTISLTPEVAPEETVETGAVEQHVEPPTVPLRAKEAGSADSKEMNGEASAPLHDASESAADAGADTVAVVLHPQGSPVAATLREEQPATARNNRGNEQKRQHGRRKGANRGAAR